MWAPAAPGHFCDLLVVLNRSLQGERPNSKRFCSAFLVATLWDMCQLTVAKKMQSRFLRWHKQSYSQFPVYTVDQERPSTERKENWVFSCLGKKDMVLHVAWVLVLLFWLCFQVQPSQSESTCTYLTHQARCEGQAAVWWQWAIYCWSCICVCVVMKLLSCFCCFGGRALHVFVSAFHLHLISYCCF